MQQATIKSRFSVEGVGVHSGDVCTLNICPAEENIGIKYVLNNSKVLARYDNVTNTQMSTQISNADGVSVITIEHLSAALYAFGITNAVIELNNNEIPILDGSARIYVENIQRVGIIQQKAKFDTIRVLKKVIATDGTKYVQLSPGENFLLDVTCDFTAKGLTTKPEFFVFGQDDFQRIAAARTFGFMSEIECVRAHGLAKGASLENTLVFDNNGNPINENGERVPNEPTCHKLLDAIGDLSLSCGMLQGKYKAYCPGHTLNNRLLRQLFSDSSNYEII